VTGRLDHAAEAAREARPQTRWASAGSLFIALLALLGFVAVTIAVASRFVFPFDQPWLASARTLDGLPVIWQAISQSANIPLIAIGVGFVLWLVWKKQRREAVVVILILIAVTAGSEGVKQLVGRPRPSGTGDGIPGVVYSYPSGHVLEVLTILGLIAVRSWRSPRSAWLRLTLILVVAFEVVLVGISRLALDEHYPSDLLGGVLGAISALGCYAWLTRPGGWADRPAPNPPGGATAP
jgi:undecaprenyl-diphosphatase